MKRRDVFVGRWNYKMPDTKPDEKGQIVLISECCFGPLETFRYGIDAEGRPFEEYEWLENDLYADENGIRNIPKSELMKKLRNMIDMFSKQGMTEWADAYKEILDHFDDLFDTRPRG